MSKKMTGAERLVAESLVGPYIQKREQHKAYGRLMDLLKPVFDPGSYYGKTIPRAFSDAFDGVGEAMYQWRQEYRAVPAFQDEGYAPVVSADGKGGMKFMFPPKLIALGSCMCETPLPVPELTDELLESVFQELEDMAGKPWLRL